jgi:Flp pilus assembly protein TadB
MILSIIILIIISAICKAIMDVISFKYNDSIFKKWKWFDPSISWSNKYKNNDPKKGPLFFGSTTFLVWTTDAWHFFQMIMLSCFIICIILGINLLLPKMILIKIIVIDIILFCILKILYGGVFELFYKYILKK